MSKPASTLTTVVRSVTRLGTSVYGNPYFVLHTDDGDVRTQINAMLNYGITNRENIGRTVRLSLTRAGRAYDVMPLYAHGDRVTVRTDDYGTLSGKIRSESGSTLDYLTVTLDPGQAGNLHAVQTRRSRVAPAL